VIKDRPKETIKSILYLKDCSNINDKEYKEIVYVSATVERSIFCRKCKLSINGMCSEEKSIREKDRVDRSVELAWSRKRKQTYGT
jgi:hypothetical protein